MDNKKILVIVAAALLAIVLSIFFCFKFNTIDTNEENMPELEAIQEQAETTSKPETETETAVEKKEIKTPVKAKTISAPVTKPAAIKETVDTKADEKAINELEVIKTITEKSEPSNVVIIDQEYKMKSQDKYTFK